MRSHTLLSDHYNSLQLFICQSSVFEDLQTFITHSSKLHSFLWMWTRRPHFWARMRDVGDLRVLTFGSCVLKTGMIKWTPKLYVRFYVFFSKSRKTWLFTFLSCCTRTLEHCRGDVTVQDDDINEALFTLLTLALAPTYLWPRLFARVWVMTIARQGLKNKVMGQGYR